MSVHGKLLTNRKADMRNFHCLHNKIKMLFMLLEYNTCRQIFVGVSTSEIVRIQQDQGIIMIRHNNIIGFIRLFLQDKRGNYGVMMGLLLFPLIGATALAVDYSNISRQRNAMQTSLDAAALATSKEYAAGGFAASSESAELAKMNAYARDFFLANMRGYDDAENADIEASFTSETKKDVNGIEFDEKSISLTARLDYDTHLAKAIGKDVIPIEVLSEVAMGNLTIEVALVIDNSGSMSSKSKLASAKSTSKKLVDQMFAAGAISNKANPVSFSLVPFAASVNIGAGNAGKDWMDINGWSTVHNENLDWSTYDIPWGATLDIQDKGTHKIAREKLRNSSTWNWKTRWDIYDMVDVDWDGCVEMRPWPHNTQDTVQQVSGLTYGQAASKSHGDGIDALFVPMFAPSEPTYYYTYQNRGRIRTSYDYYSYGNDYTDDFRKSDNVLFAASNYQRGNYQNTRQDWIWRYQNSHVSNGISGSGFGPNYSCTSRPLTELTTNKNTIKNSIDNMIANGNTNVQAGVSWGWRTLSPQEPFTGGRSYDDVDNRKYLIVLTDGNNTYSGSSTPNRSTYAAWAYAKTERIEEGLSYWDRPDLYKGSNPYYYEDKMNVHTLQTCENARKAGITIFSIAFDVSNGSSVKQLLDACAGSGLTSGGQEIVSSGSFYYDVNSNGLDDAMASIASQISDLRLKR